MLQLIAALMSLNGDPSSSWMSYAKFEADAIITMMNVTVVVPENPKRAWTSLS